VAAAEVFIGVLASLIALVPISLLAETLRRAPRTPPRLVRAPGVPVNFEDIGGMSVRYIKTGTGPNLVLLHTLRTQLDLFEKVVPGLAKHFTVYALDYPGHGYSDIPSARYDADFFAHSAEAFLDALDLRDTTLCGVSIGGAIALILAARRNTRVARVVAINPYDYAKGRGMTRSSLLGWMITVTSENRLIGETVMRLRNFIIMKAVCLIWGDKDWSKPDEREHDRRLIPDAESTTIENGGHFLPLDRPQELQELIIRFAAGSRARCG
jgi:pimeloyl-ACP methyl ester carboxylesterase